VPPYSAPYLLLEEEKAETEEPQVLQVALVVVAGEMAAITQVALATPRQLAPLKEAAVAPAMTVALNLLEAAAAVHLLLDQMRPDHQQAALAVQELLVRLPVQALLVLAAEVAALM
jgi:hypothetical protein